MLCACLKTWAPHHSWFKRVSATFTSRSVLNILFTFGDNYSSGSQHVNNRGRKVFARAYSMAGGSTIFLHDPINSLVSAASLSKKQKTLLEYPGQSLVLPTSAGSDLFDEFVACYSSNILLAGIFSRLDSLEQRLHAGGAAPLPRVASRKDASSQYEHGALKASPALHGLVSFGSTASKKKEEWNMEMDSFALSCISAIPLLKMIHVASIWKFYAKAGYAHSPLFRMLSGTHTHHLIAGAGCRVLSELIWSFGKMPIILPLVNPLFFKELISSVRTCLPRFTPRELAMSIYAIGELLSVGDFDVNDGICKGGAVFRFMTKDMRGNSASTLSTMGCINLVEVLKDELITIISNKLSGFEPIEIATSIRAFSRMLYIDDVFSRKVMNTLMKFDNDSLSPRIIVSILHSLSKLTPQIEPSERERLSFYVWACENLENFVHSFTAQDCANIGIAYYRAGIVLSPELNEKFCAKVMNLTHSNKIQPQHLSALLCYLHLFLSSGFTSLPRTFESNDGLVLREKAPLLANFSSLDGKLKTLDSLPPCNMRLMEKLCDYSSRIMHKFTWKDCMALVTALSTGYLRDEKLLRMLYCRVLASFRGGSIMKKMQVPGVMLISTLCLNITRLDVNLMNSVLPGGEEKIFFNNPNEEELPRLNSRENEMSIEEERLGTSDDLNFVDNEINIAEKRLGRDDNIADDLLLMLFSQLFYYLCSFDFNASQISSLKLYHSLSNIAFSTVLANAVHVNFLNMLIFQRFYWPLSLQHIHPTREEILGIALRKNTSDRLNHPSQYSASHMPGEVEARQWHIVFSYLAVVWASENAGSMMDQSSGISVSNRGLVPFSLANLQSMNFFISNKADLCVDTAQSFVGEYSDMQPWKSSGFHKAVRKTVKRAWTQNYLNKDASTTFGDRTWLFDEVVAGPYSLDIVCAAI